MSKVIKIVPSSSEDVQESRSKLVRKNKQIVTTIKAGQENKQTGQSFDRTRVKQEECSSNSQCLVLFGSPNNFSDVS